MKRVKSILIGVVCVALLILSWYVGTTAETDAQKQEKLLDEATLYLNDEIYVKAVPLLEEAASYNEAMRGEAEDKLKDAYLQLMNTQGYMRKYTNLLDEQMNRENAAEEVFLEAANFYLERGKLKDALAVMKAGVEKNGGAHISELYENTRYAYRANRALYDDVTAIFNGGAQVMRDGKWGIAAATGELVIPCEYEYISTFSNGEAVAFTSERTMGVDKNNNRIALCHDNVLAVSNFAENRVWIKLEDGWHIANGDFTKGGVAFEEVGMFSNGASPAKKDGKWGLINVAGNQWVLEPEFDGIIMDELGRAYTQNLVFVKNGAQVLLLVRDEKSKEFSKLSEEFEDARPFENGFAAVRKDGKWGYIDTEGNVRIDFTFDEALSFGQHLAAVKIGDMWGYINTQGKQVIEPIFYSARSFSGGCAPVKTENGWQFISLIEYEGDMGL